MFSSFFQRNQKRAECPEVISRQLIKKLQDFMTVHNAFSFLYSLPTVYRLLYNLIMAMKTICYILTGFDRRAE